MKEIDVSSSPIMTFYSALHQQHAPVLEYLHGKQVPYFEMPQRIENIRSALQDVGLIRLYMPSDSEIVSKEFLSTVHDAQMLDYFEHISANIDDVLRDDFAVYGMQPLIQGDEYYYESVFPPRITDKYTADERRRFYVLDNTSPIGAGTWVAVQMSASLAFHAAQYVLNGEKHAYALCRPPGHHAGPDFAMGYCYVNNAAVAAQTLSQHGRVAIIDIDYHHGNGTQAIFWDNPDVFFVSIHVDPMLDYPYFAGFASETGGDKAQNGVLNLPLAHETDEITYLNNLDHALSCIKKFGPNAMIVSLGFDTFIDDPIARFQLDVSSFSKIGSRIASLNLPTVYVQEGGYATEKLGDIAVSFFQGVLGTE